MKIFKIAKISFPVWLGKEMEKVTPKFSSPQHHNINPENIYMVQQWAKETSTDLTNMSFLEAMSDANIYFFNKENEANTSRNLSVNDLNMNAIITMINSLPVVYQYFRKPISLENNNIKIMSIKKIPNNRMYFDGEYIYLIKIQILDSLELIMNLDFYTKTGNFFAINPF